MLTNTRSKIRQHDSEKSGNRILLPNVRWIIFFALAFGFLMGFTSSAQARAVSAVSVASQVGTLTYGTVSSAAFTVNVTTNTAGGTITVSPTVSGLTSGATGTFSPINRVISSST